MLRHVNEKIINIDIKQFFRLKLLLIQILDCYELDIPYYIDYLLEYVNSFSGEDAGSLINTVLSMKQIFDKNGINFNK
jgi:hypothetical protein